MLVLGIPVPATRDRSCRALCGLELAETQAATPGDRAGRGPANAALRSLTDSSALFLIPHGPDQPVIAEQPQHGHLPHPPAFAAQHPDFTMTPDWTGQSMPDHWLPGRVPDGPGPRAFRLMALPGSDLPPTPGPFRHKPAEPHGRPCPLPRGSPQGVFERPQPALRALHPAPGSRPRPHPTPRPAQRPPPPTAAHGTWAWTHLPRAQPSPPQEKSAFHRPIDSSETFSRRAASAIVISPAKTLNTIPVFFSTGITGGLPISDPPSRPTQQPCHKD